MATTTTTTTTAHGTNTNTNSAPARELSHLNSRYRTLRGKSISSPRLFDVFQDDAQQDSPDDHQQQDQKQQQLQSPRPASSNGSIRIRRDKRRAAPVVPPLPTFALTPKPINVPLLPKFKCRDRVKKPPQAAQPAVPAAAAATPTAGADDDDSADEDTPRPSTAPAPAASTKPLSFEPWPGALTRDLAAREVADNNTPQTPKPKRALLEKLSFFSKSKKQSPSLTSSTQPEKPSMVSAVSNDKKAVWNTVIVASERDPGEDDLRGELYDQLRSQHHRDHLPAQHSRYVIPEPSPQGKPPSCAASPSPTPAKPVHEEPIGPMPEPKPWFPSATEHSARLRSQSAHSNARHPSNGSAAFFLAPSLASPSVPQTPSSANRPQRRAGPALMPLHTPPPHYPASCSTSLPQHRYPPRAMPFAAKVSGTPLPRPYGRPCLPSPAATR